MAVTDPCSPSTQGPSPSKAPGSGHTHVPTRLLFARLNGEGCQLGNRREERFPIWEKGGEKEGEGGWQGPTVFLAIRCTGLGQPGKPGMRDPLEEIDRGKRKEGCTI